MVCIYCAGNTQVTNSRAQKRANSIWRRRTCLDCGNIFTSIELADLTSSLVVKSNAGIEPFLRDKLLLSVYDSLRHRKTAVADAAGLTATIIGQLYSHIAKATVEKGVITSVAAHVLRRFDKVAYTYYTAFHPVSQKLKVKSK